MDHELFDLDPNNLVKHSVEQPRLIAKYSELQAKARKFFDQAKSNLELVEAEVALAIRKHPEKFGLEKTTESTIQAAIKIQPEYQAAVDKFHKAKHKNDVYLAYCNALEHRKRMIETLVTLHGQSYFSTPVNIDDLDLPPTEKRRETRKRMKPKK